MHSFCFMPLVLLGKNLKLTRERAIMAVFFAWTFLPAMLFFLVLYGCYSYVKTNKIILPNLLLLLFTCLYYFWIFYSGLLSTKNFDDVDFALLIKCLPFVGISVFCGLIVKLVLWLKTRMSKDDYSYSENSED